MMSDPTKLLGDDWNITLYGEIGIAAALYVQQSVTEAILKRRPFQNLLIMSGGGGVSQGLDIVASIRQAQKEGIEIRGRVNSTAYSMAAYILQACDWRSMSPVAQLMLHGWEEGGSGGGIDKKTRAALDISVKNMEAAMVGLVKSRSKLTDKQIEDIFADSSHHYFTASEALEAGLVDEVCW